MRTTHAFLAAALIAAPLSPVALAGTAQAAPPGAPASPCAAATAGTLTFTREDPTAARAALTFASGVAPDSLRLLASEKVTGPCAATLRAAVTENLVTADGQVLRRLPTGGVAPKPGLSFADQTIDAGEPHPEGAGFRMAYRVGYRRDGNQLTTNYVGVWQEGTGSAVRYFSKRPDGGFTAPKPLLTSASPLRSVTYFPAPDSPAGQLGLVQEAGDGVRLISVNWSHRGIFG
jgi:hypothetical protein